MSIFDESNRKYKLRKESEKKAEQIEKKRLIDLENSERKLIQAFNGYLSKMSDSFKKLGFDSMINQMDSSPWIRVKELNGSKFVKLTYKVSDTNQTKGTVTVNISCSDKDEVEVITYLVDENERVTKTDGSKYDLEKEVIHHYEEILSNF